MKANELESVPMPTTVDECLHREEEVRKAASAHQAAADTLHTYADKLKAHRYEVLMPKEEPTKFFATWDWGNPDGTLIIWDGSLNLPVFTPGEKG